jgi:hypothetical protein
MDRVWEPRPRSLFVRSVLSTLATSNLKLETPLNWLCFARHVPGFRPAGPGIGFVWHDRRRMGILERWNSGILGYPSAIGFVWHLWPRQVPLPAFQLAPIFGHSGQLGLFRTISSPTGYRLPATGYCLLASFDAIAPALAPLPACTASAFPGRCGTDWVRLAQQARPMAPLAPSPARDHLRLCRPIGFVCTAGPYGGSTADRAGPRPPLSM